MDNFLTTISTDELASLREKLAQAERDLSAAGVTLRDLQGELAQAEAREKHLRRALEWCYSLTPDPAECITEALTATQEPKEATDETSA